MAEIRLVGEGMPDLLPMQGRSEGVHVSHIIHDLCLRLGHYKATDDEEKGPDRYTRMGLGSAWEWALIERYTRTFVGRYSVIGELECDGFYLTPDMIDETDLAVHEMKCTWASSRHAADSEKFWRYWVQLKAYCKALGTTKGVLHVVFVNGDYRDNRSPVYRVWECEWTQEEIDANWHMLVEHEKAMTADREERGHTQ